MDNNKPEQIVITMDDIKTGRVIFDDDVIITRSLSTSFDMDARKNDESVTVKVKYLFGNSDLMTALEHTVNDLKVKTNTRLKKTSVDSETYQSYLADNDCSFEFPVYELDERKPQKKISALQEGRNAVTRMSDTERAEYRKYLEANGII